MRDFVGFAEIKKDATTCRGAVSPDEFIGKICRVMEFGHDGCVLVINPQSTALAMFEKEDIHRSFKCGYFSGVLTPPELNHIEEMLYYHKAISRKGGYNHVLMSMVIQASLMKGKFTDDFLWQKQ